MTGSGGGGEFREVPIGGPSDPTSDLPMTGDGVTKVLVGGSLEVGRDIGVPEVEGVGVTTIRHRG